MSFRFVDVCVDEDDEREEEEEEEDQDEDQDEDQEGIRDSGIPDSEKSIVSEETIRENVTYSKMKIPFHGFY
jgi:hypothetical protein